MLDVHGESETTWPANDALCSALQIINHIQDCGADYRNLDRVYIPLDAMAKEGTEPTALAAPRATPGLLACLHAIAARTELLVRQGSELPRQVHDLRLGLETAVIARLARRLVSMLNHRDPLSEKVHLARASVLAWTLVGIGAGLVDRSRRATLGHASTMRGA